MAVIEIAKIKVRRGQENVTGIPQLDSGEFGWAVDTQRLFIGNGSITEGAPEVGNTEIITEHNLPNIFSLFPVYQYQGNTPSSPLNYTVGRTIQEKLDDIVNVVDFGAVGDGTTDCTSIIQNAIDEIFLNSDKTDPRSRKILYFPAGVYLITGTIYVPSYANLYGDGQDKTILELGIIETPLMQLCDSTSIPGSYVVLPGLTSLGSPRFINITGMTLRYQAGIDSTGLRPLINADCTSNVYITNCRFQGLNQDDFQFNVSDHAGIYIRGQVALTSNNLFVQGCTFESLYNGIRSDYDVQEIYISHNNFIDCYRAIACNVSLEAGNTVGIIRSRIESNTFTDIYKEAIYIGSNGNTRIGENITAFNSYYNVGNDKSGGDLVPVSSVVYFGSSGNISRDDIFTRNLSVNNTTTTVNFLPNVSGTSFISDNILYQKSLSSSSGQITKMPYSGDYQSIGIQYMFDNSLMSRKGNLKINVSSSSPLGNTATIVDSFSYHGNDDGGITFLTDLDATNNVVSLSYYNNLTTGTIKYQIQYLQ